MSAVEVGGDIEMGPPSLRTSDIAADRLSGGRLQIQTMATRLVRTVTTKTVGGEVGATMEACEVEAAGGCGGSGLRDSEMGPLWPLTSLTTIAVEWRLETSMSLCRSILLTQKEEREGGKLKREKERIMRRGKRKEQRE